MKWGLLTGMFRRRVDICFEGVVFVVSASALFGVRTDSPQYAAVDDEVDFETVSGIGGNVFCPTVQNFAEFS